MIVVNIDEAKFDELAREELRKRLNELEHRFTFWDSQELRRQTCMSWNTIQDTFFHDENFKKVKVGGKWYFPAKETEEYLIAWLQ